MPGELFIDTSGWFTLAVTSSAQHNKAKLILRERIGKRVRIVTTNLVIAETHALLLRRTGRPAAMTFVREVSKTPNVVVSSSPEIEKRAVSDWLERFQDQAFSFTDAVSFVVMKERRILDALAVDHHFAAAGFNVLPGP